MIPAKDGAVYLATRERDAPWQVPTAPISWTETAYEPRVELYEGMRRSIRWCLEQGLEL